MSRGNNAIVRLRGGPGPGDDDALHVQGGREDGVEEGRRRVESEVAARSAEHKKRSESRDAGGLFLGTAGLIGQPLAVLPGVRFKTAS
ncbi:hypothetical protein SNOG_02279 [Parastagonospora nodorum SN15]|uniref:Uncharacterized protein n=1 Tax=Phaeosphaeria nodorum (strain SN15 / ATCC MYA-4574 / FGSC 10173) TaxID=321614 RepID=Q0V135_PHANO|nr:hypothetical protein SNOG_02279 [Parastagonospora nodorum SN15]EAT90491.1 hypothetical protein SNOG_02279 [Parastagonospora nodorum SN15]